MRSNTRLLRNNVHNAAYSQGSIHPRLIQKIRSDMLPRTHATDSGVKYPIRTQQCCLPTPRGKWQDYKLASTPPSPPRFSFPASEERWSRIPSLIALPSATAGRKQLVVKMPLNPTGAPKLGLRREEQAKRKGAGRAIQTAGISPPLGWRKARKENLAGVATLLPP